MNKRQKQSKFIILTFYSEGQPHDSGLPLSAAEQLFRKATVLACDRYLAYTPRTLLVEDRSLQRCLVDYSYWLNTHPLKSQLGAYNEIWAKLGFLMWKPQLIKNVLGSDLINEGDILLYHDVDCIKYPVYLDGCNTWRELSHKILEDLKCDLFIPAGLPLKVDVKADLIRRTVGMKRRDKCGLWCGLALIRKSQMTMKFVSEWATMCSDLELISPLPNSRPEKSFIWHSVDQSVAGVLSVLWKDRGLLDPGWPKFKLHERRLSNNTLLLV